MIINKGRFDRNFPVLTAVACSICVIVFVAVNVLLNQPHPQLARWGFVSDFEIYRGAYWGLITSAFVHIEPIHLFFNLYWLWILGGAFERLFGPLRWLGFVLLAAFVSSAVQLASGSMGIGMSGVGYALFGFGWFTRNRYPEMARLVNPRTVQMFIIWGVLCVVLTSFKVMNIGNFAHAGGLVFGAAVGGLVTQDKERSTYASTLALLVGISFVPLFWNPLSAEWVGNQAVKATQHQEYARAIAMYLRYLKIGYDKGWAWHGLAEIYGFQGKHAEYREAIIQLKTIDPALAELTIARYGKP